MGFRLYQYRLKCLIKNKSNMFWTFLFPIVLSTFFSMAFGNLYNAELFATIPIAVVQTKEYTENADFQKALKETKGGDTDSGTMFKVTECTKEEARQLLDDSKVDGYIEMGEATTLYVKKSGLNQTIIKIFLDSYSQITNTVTHIAASNPAAVAAVIEDVSNPVDYLVNAQITDKKPDLTLNYYYALLAMTCLYGCFWGVTEITLIQADLSVKGARINIAPVHKLKLLMCNLAAAYTIHMAGVMILMAYFIQVLKLNFSDNLGYVLLTCFLGSLLGVTFGAMIGAMTKKDEGFKSAVLSGVVMTGCFLAGLMMVQMKYIIAMKAPFMKYVNPAHIITDAFYSLYYYDTFGRFYMNVALMLGYTGLFSLITYLIIRRRQYASL